MMTGCCASLARNTDERKVAKPVVIPAPAPAPAPAARRRAIATVLLAPQPPDLVHVCLRRDYLTGPFLFIDRDSIVGHNEIS